MASTCSGKPRPSTGLLASTITQTSVKISWSASTGSDFPVGSYKVSIYRKQDGGSAATEQNVNSLEATFSGLTCGKDYTVEVSARSAMFSVYSDKQTLSFRTSLKGIYHFDDFIDIIRSFKSRICR